MATDFKKLPILPVLDPRALPAGLERMDDDAAARFGLVARGSARAEGLVDRFGRAHTALRISVTERCNLRCTYCMPEQGVELLAREDVLTFEEIERLAALFVTLGIRSIRITGGEPLVRKGLGELVQRLGALKLRAGARLLRLTMSSNGLLLKGHLDAFARAGLDGMNLSLDTLRPERFLALTRREGLEETLAAIRLAARALPSVKVNAVAMKGVNEDELAALARTFAVELGLDMRYIEYMPFEGNHWSDSRLLSATAIRAALSRDFSLAPLDAHAAANGQGSGTAQLYALHDHATHARLPGRVGIIPSMTEPFCTACSRLRLTADGKLRWCLLDEAELDLKGPLREGGSDEALAALIAQGLGLKRAGHAPAGDLLAMQAASGRSMVRIGG